MSSGRVTPVILSGGAGTRLWPLSRTSRPKQMLALGGEETMLQMTMRRVADAGLFAAPVIVANVAQAGLIESQFKDIGSLILEPCARNTAPAIALAALSAAPGDVLLVMPSDHLIRDERAFAAAVRAGMPFVEQGWLVTFGIAPDAPETGYGYISRGAELAAGVFAVAAFVEKPDRAAAELYLADGGYAWNGGIFLFSAASYLAALEAHAPAILSAARDALDKGSRAGARIMPEAAAFAASPSLSIDYAVMEKAERVAVVPVAMGWSDVGSFDALYDVGAADGDGNVLSGDALAIGSGNCLVHSDGSLVVTVGVHDLVVIATGDAVLVIPRGETQRVREAVEALRAKGHPVLDR